MQQVDSRKASRAAGGLSAFLSLWVGLTVAAMGCEQRPAEADIPDDAPEMTALFDSPEALARAFLKALEEDDVEKLKSFALTEEQFRYYVWPQLPSSRPERGVPFEYGWNDLRTKSLASLATTHTRYKGEHLEFLEIQFEDETTDYQTYLVHRDARVKVRDEEGRERWLDLFGSVMEWQGKFKLFSYVTD